MRFKYPGSVSPEFRVIAVHAGWVFAYRVGEISKPEILPVFSEWELIEDPKPEVKPSERIKEINREKAFSDPVASRLWMEQSIIMFLDELHEQGKLGGSK